MKSTFPQGLRTEKIKQEQMNTPELLRYAGILDLAFLIVGLAHNEFLFVAAAVSEHMT
jgi:hypothetical protein